MGRVELLEMWAFFYVWLWRGGVPQFVRTVMRMLRSQKGRAAILLNE
jgi:hypothetical protein